MHLLILFLIGFAVFDVRLDFVVCLLSFAKRSFFSLVHNIYMLFLVHPKKYASEFIPPELAGSILKKKTIPLNLCYYSCYYNLR